MKKISFSILTALAFLFFTTTLVAQKTGAPGNAVEKKSSDTALPFCDQVMGNYGADLQKRANQECRTVYPCIDCIDRASNKVTCNQMVVQPNKDAICAVKATAVVEQATTQKILVLDQNDFALNIIQTPCFFAGITLKVLANRTNSTMADQPGDYQYAWTVDGVAMGSANNIYCVSGKTATVKVTQVATSRTKTMTVEISNRLQDNQVPTNTSKPLAVYQKTSCFGTCPSYIVEFYNDGSVNWNGRANVLPLGQKRSKISADAYEKLEAKARAINFLNLKNSYPEEQIADASATILYMNIDGREKQVSDIFEAPKGLDELEKMFDDLIRKLGWAKAKTPAPMQKKLEAPNKDKKASGN
ncbi:MAG: DUF6438 domain-containing protein [Saprospiraceae bacterium]